MAISGASLFALSSLYYARRLNGTAVLQRTLLSIFDLGTYFCIVVLVVGGLIFPILRPITDPGFQLYLLGQKSLAMGLYTGLVLCSIVVVFRVALQFLFARSNGVIIATHAPLVGNSIPLGPAPSDDSSLERNLSSIRLELSRLREEIALLSAPNTALRLSNLVGAEVSPSNREPKVGAINRMETMPSNLTKSYAQNLPALVSTPKATSSEGSPYERDLPEESASSETFTPTLGGPPIPDAALDNPWASVLSRRLPPRRGVTPDIPPELEIQPQPVPAPQILQIQSIPAKTDQISQDAASTIQETQVIVAPPILIQETQIENVPSEPASEPQVDTPLQSLQESKLEEILTQTIQELQIAQTPAQPAEEKQTESLPSEPARVKKTIRKTRKKSRKEKPVPKSPPISTETEKTEIHSSAPTSPEKSEEGNP